jgi:hypothetical protein
MRDVELNKHDNSICPLEIVARASIAITRVVVVERIGLGVVARCGRSMRAMPMSGVRGMEALGRRFSGEFKLCNLQIIAVRRNVRLRQWNVRESERLPNPLRFGVRPRSIRRVWN